MRINGRRVSVLLIGGLVSGLLMFLVRDDEIIRPLQGQDFSVTGQWSAQQPWPVTAVHDHMLPTGKVLFYGYSDEAWLWDPQTDGLTPAAHVGYNIFCTGHSWMADGRLMVSGGHIANNVGLPNAAIYDPYIDSWTKLPNMNAGRWYPTNTTLPNGDVLVVSGGIDTVQGVNKVPQIWRAATKAWQDLTGAVLALPNYPRMYVSPNGKLFVVGPSQTTRYLDTSGNGSWTVVGNSGFGYRDYGSSVLYDEGKILIVGGADPPTNTAEVIDLNAATPAWRSVSPMVNKRRQNNATLLPDGTVLVTGGSNLSGFDNNAGAVYAAELWDPVTEKWTTVASFTKYRGYHSFGLLLPDGRVLTGGGDFDKSAEVYSPGYLFKGARPVIASAASTLIYGQPFFITTAEASEISRVSLIRLSSVTHSFNMDQRINQLAFSAAADGLNVASPTNANLSPPGYYMLFILNGNGVPSVAKIVKVDFVPPTAPASPSALTATATSASRIDLKWTDGASNEDGFRIERCLGDGCSDFQQIVQTNMNVTTYSDSGLAASTTYNYRVRAFNSVGVSDYSNIATAATPAQPPTPIEPSNLTATAVSPTQINLAWADASADESGFKIERCQESGCLNFAEITQVAANTTSYADSRLQPATVYTYRVRAFNAVGNSAYSNQAAATTQPAVTTGPVYYIDVTGDDANPGNLGTPWKTIQKAANTLPPGGTVIVNPGSYNERVQMTRSGTTGNLIRFQAQGAVVTKGFTITGSYVKVSGFEVTDTDDNDTNGVGIYISGSFNEVVGNHIHDVARQGIFTQPASKSNKLQNNVITHAGHTGIWVKGTNQVVEGNDISGSIMHPAKWAAPPTWIDADGIVVEGSGHVFRKNYIHDIFGDDPRNSSPHIDAFQFPSVTVSNIIIEQNRVSIPPSTKFPTSCYQASSIQGPVQNVTIINNLVYDVCRGFNIQGPSTGILGIKILDNTFVNLTDYGAELINTPNAVVKNNIFYNIAKAAKPYVNRGGTTTSANIGNNLAYLTGGTAFPNDRWNVDPQFVNLAAKDFRLQPTSPAITAGVTLAEVQNDFDSFSRPQGDGYDIGAFEFAPTVNRPPIVNAGKDQTLTLPTSANLTGTAIDDGLPADTLTLAWSVFSGPGSLTFGSANAAATTAKFSVAGNYVLRLTADDGGVSSTDDVSIIVNDLLQNPSFDVDGNSDGRPDAWTSNAQFTRNGVAVQSGSYSGRHYSTTNSSYTIGQTVNNLTAGTNYNFSGWVNIPQTTDVFSLTLEVQWFNASNVLIGTATVKKYSAPTAWDNAKASLIAPTGTKYAKVNMVVSSLNATIYVDNFSFLPN